MFSGVCSLSVRLSLVPNFKARKECEHMRKPLTQDVSNRYSYQDTFGS